MARGIGMARRHTGRKRNPRQKVRHGVAGRAGRPSRRSMRRRRPGGRRLVRWLPVLCSISVLILLLSVVASPLLLAWHAGGLALLAERPQPSPRWRGMSEPMYRRIAEELREQIASGELEFGVQRVAEHCPRRHQVAQQPWPGRDAHTPGRPSF
jgi:hypothetical protein